ncbi:MAG: FAD-dependent oxidoreductase [Chloroflexota bacterium]|nr:FAD-dependent oxidoreductase [Chloroflexota bacterium]
MAMPDSTYDVAIVGGGIAGLSAAIHAGRSGLRCLLVERMMPGGQIFNATHIENMPGIAEPVSGVELSERLHDQAAGADVEIALSEVTGLQPDGPHWLVRKYDGDVRAKTVIIAAGSSFKKLGLDREDDFYGSGISNCASCDGPMFNDQVVGVVGGGDSALDEALALTEFASKVILFHRDAELDGQAVLQQRVQSDPKIDLRPNIEVTALLSDTTIEAVSTRHTESGETSQVDLAGLFIFVGLQPNTGFLDGVVPLDNAGHVETDIWMRTPAKGIFAVGDIRQDSAALLTSSAGDGATAAVAAKRYIDTGHWPE